VKMKKNMPTRQCDAAPVLLALGMAFMLATACLAASLPPAKYTQWTSDDEVFVPMRDGVHLSADVLLPKDATGKLPTILVRTTYFSEESSELDDMRQLWLKQGFAFVVEMERGFAPSEGVYRTYLQSAKEDGEDTINWIAKQPWSNGKIGMIGCSSSGEVQPPAAANNNPALVATIPAGIWGVGSIPGNYTQGVHYRGGVPYSGFWWIWYSWRAPIERMMLPPNSTQAERVRLSNSFRLAPQNLFDPTASGPVDLSSEMNLSKLSVLPDEVILRKLGSAMTPYDEYITYTPADPRWDSTEFITSSTASPTPALDVTSLDDPAVTEATRWYHYLQEQRTPNQFLIVGGGPHCSAIHDEVNREMTFAEKAHQIADAQTPTARRALDESLTFSLGDMKFGDLQGGDARYAGEDRGYAILFLRWFNHYLRGVANDVTSMPKVQIYVTNVGWISGAHWPLASTQFTNYYLRSWSGSQLHWNTGTLSTSPPDHAAEDSFIYDPGNPTPSLGGACCGPDVARDQRPIETRKDVLVYSTEPLKEPVTIAGPVTAVLYVSSSALDTDFMVKLVDVYPDGKAINLSQDAFRVRYRDGYDKQVMMERGNVYKIELRDMVSAIQFPVGHRIQLDIASSNFPDFERNLNTGGKNFDESEWVIARNTVHHGPQYRSHLVLPVVPDVSDRATAYAAYAAQFRQEQE
jgi:uncharacterized protein